MEMEQIFSDIKIANFSTTIVGPTTAEYFAIYGATVIEVESATHPCILRTAPPFKDQIPGLDRSGYWPNYNACKYGLALNLNKSQGMEIARRLVLWADVVLENFTPRVTEKWGLTYDELKRIKPDLILASTTQLGQSGPHTAFKGFGYQAAAIAGYYELTGWPDGDPVGPYAAYTDFIAHRYLMVAVLAALDYRRRTGKGQHIDHSQLESSLHFLAPAILDYSANKRVMSRQGNRDPHAAPHGIYRCKGDDCWCAIAVYSQEEWQAFCKVIGSPHWTNDPRFINFVARKEHEDALNQLVEEWSQNHTHEEVMHMMQGAGVAAAVVAKGEDLHNDPQFKHRGHYSVLDHAVIGPHTYDNPGFRLSETPGEMHMPAPCIGQHNEYVCTQILGMSDDEFVDLMAAGVFE